jgi:hypothetical protein
MAAAHFFLIAQLQQALIASRFTSANTVNLSVNQLQSFNRFIAWRVRLCEGD